jgi:hypothetical protein
MRFDIKRVGANKRDGRGRKKSEVRDDREIGRVENAIGDEVFILPRRRYKSCHVM